MPFETEAHKRPGGRTARNRDSVHDAVKSLIAEGGVGAVTVAAVADRSGVHNTSIYRRWGSTQDLVFEVVLENTAAHVPTDDNGSFRADLRAFASHAADSMASPIGAAMMQTLIALPLDDEGSARRAYWTRRHRDIQSMFDRAAARDESVSSPEDVLESLLAPMYFRRFVTGRPIDDTYLDDLVSRVIADHALLG